MKHIVIAILSDLYHETRLLRMVESLQADGWRVTLIAARGSEHPFQGVELLQLPLRPRRRLKRYFLSFMWRLYRLAGSLEADCFLAIDPPALFPLALRRRCRPLLYDSREYFTELGTVVRRPLIRKFWYFLERYGIRRATGWMTVCESIERELRSLYGVEPGRVIRNVSRRQAAEPNDDLRRRLQLPPERPLLLYQGGLWAAYDFTPLNAAMRELPDCVLVYLGGGPLLSSLQEWVERNGLTDRIRFHPRVTPGELPRLTAAADIGVILIPPLGKSYQYLLPNKLFEYIQAGLPLLVSAFPELMRIVDEYGIGIGTDPSDSRAITASIRELVSEWRRGSYRDGLVRAAAELNWEREEQRFLEAVREVS